MGSVVDFRSRTAIIDRDLLAAEALARTLACADHLVEVVEPARAASHPPTTDLALVAVRGGSRLASPVALVRVLVRRGTDVILIAEPECRVLAAECIEAGALGIVHTTESLERLTEVVAHMCTGGGPTGSGDERDRLLADLRRHRRSSTARTEVFDRLTPRERQVLGQLMAGRSAAEIATADFVAVETVRSHIKAILRKLHVGSQVAAVSLAYRLGWRAEYVERVTGDAADIA